MIKPVNKHILVEIVKKDAYEKSKMGILVATESQDSPPILVVAALSEGITLPVKVGDRIFTWDQRLFYTNDGDKKVAFIKEENIAGIQPAE